MEEAPSRRLRPPNFQECQICRREFGSRSLQIHLIQCAEKNRVSLGGGGKIGKSKKGGKGHHPKVTKLKEINSDKKRAARHEKKQLKKE